MDNFYVDFSVVNDEELVGFVCVNDENVCDLSLNDENVLLFV